MVESTADPSRILALILIPLHFPLWYYKTVSGNPSVVVGNRGRIVIPAEVRDRAGLEEGAVLCLLETPGGLILMTREQLRDRVRSDLAGLDLVGELLSDRRAEAVTEDAA